MPDHRDRPASALAHGPAKSNDIERVRRDVAEADAQSVRAEEVSVARHRHTDDGDGTSAETEFLPVQVARPSAAMGLGKDLTIVHQPGNDLGFA